LHNVILIGLGANLPHPRHGPPRATLAAALEAIGAGDVVIRRRSAWYESAPVPPSDQPLFVNAVAELASPLDPTRLLTHLHGVEVAFGRVRGEPNAPRVVDLDLLDYDGRVSRPGEVPILPHPRMAERAFVVLPLLDLAPDWRHPVGGASIGELAGRLPSDQWARRLME
jgi:2-amino-4-hydroxy-6-hydroxymethyldihydropteridine diphosphokinase